MPTDQSPRTPFSFTIQIGAESLQVAGSVPAGECPVTDLLPLLLGLGEAVVAAASRQIPPTKSISCGPGCGACCRQLVPISLSEAAYLRNQVLPHLEPNHRQRVCQRVAAAAAALDHHGLFDGLRALPEVASPEIRQALGLRYFVLGLPCAFLESDSCSIHPQRPLACREYLVTSPANHCSRPDHSAVSPVAVPQKPSHALIQLDAAASTTPGWRTMIDALADPDPPPARIIPHPIGFLKDFLLQLLNA